MIYYVYRYTCPVCGGEQHLYEGWWIVCLACREAGRVSLTPRTSHQDLIQRHPERWRFVEYVEVRDHADISTFLVERYRNVRKTITTALPEPIDRIVQTLDQHPGVVIRTGRRLAEHEPDDAS